MNIFLLDYNTERCASYHMDKHVVKMLLESCQILSTVCNSLGLPTEYRPTHRNHPCVIWAGESLYNWLWLRELLYALDEEYRYRYGSLKHHRSFDVALRLTVPPIAKETPTLHCQAMPEEFRVPQNPMLAYRNYYRTVKRPLAIWTKRIAPIWY